MLLWFSWFNFSKSLVTCCIFSLFLPSILFTAAFSFWALVAGCTVPKEPLPRVSARFTLYPLTLMVPSGDPARTSWTCKAFTMLKQNTCIQLCGLSDRLLWQAQNEVAQQTPSKQLLTHLGKQVYMHIQKHWQTQNFQSLMHFLLFYLGAFWERVKEQNKKADRFKLW